MECSIVKLGVVIVAGGSGTRLGGVTPKQFLFLGQLPILAHAINTFAASVPNCDIVVVLPQSYIEYWANLSARFPIAAHRTVIGGEQRFHSVKAGIEELNPSVDIIAVHDGARPLLSKELILRCTKQSISQGSAVPVVEVVDSMRLIEDDGLSRHFDRARLRIVQTPQMFDATTLRRAYRQEWSADFTDDSSVVERSGERVYLCEGERQNIKITTSEDLIYAQGLIEMRDE